MAKIVDSLIPETPKRPGPNHPWNEWLDGKVREAVEGEDFRDWTWRFQQALRDFAKHHGRKARTKVLNRTTVRFFFCMPDSAK